jgi:CHASE1-domain containing sensor protein
MAVISIHRHIKLPFQETAPWKVGILTFREPVDQKANLLGWDVAKK